ncbi:MAG TPA: DUF1266 domain-containing protein [Rectinemataceae bacterium]|nr:DUF1266 domain-containing protein [Rectinemataceae bacterium]
MKGNLMIQEALAGLLFAGLFTLALASSPVFAEGGVAPNPPPISQELAQDPDISSVDYTVISYPTKDSNGENRIKISLLVKATLSPGLGAGKEIVSATLKNGDENWNFSAPASGDWPLFGPGQSAGISNLDRGGGTILPIGLYTLSVVLASGKTLVKDFDVLPPGEMPSAETAYLRTASYGDLVIPWQADALAVPDVLSAQFEKSTIVIKFRIDDPRCANAYFEFSNGTRLVWKSNTVVDPATGAGRPWFNGGKGLLTDGSVNVVVFDRKSMKAFGNFAIEDTSGVQTIAVDGLRYRGTSTPSSFKHESISIARTPTPPPAVAADGGATTTSIPNPEPAAPRAPLPSPLPGPGPNDRAYYNWLTGLSALLSLINGQSSVGLAPLPPPPDYAKGVAETLRGSWSVSSGADLEKAIDMLLAGGNNASWQSYLAAIENNPGMSDAELLAKVDGQAVQFRLDFVRSHKDGPHGRNILAWDLGRAAMLVRWGYACGYIGPEEAWARLEDIGRRTVAEFQSWEDFGLDYEMGRVFWKGEEMDEGLKLFREVQGAFVRLTGESGEWTNTHWPDQKE